MRISHTGDLHIRTSHPRWKTLHETLTAMTRGFHEDAPDLHCVAGDLFDSPRPSIADVDEVAAFLQALAATAPVKKLRRSIPSSFYSCLRTGFIGRALIDDTPNKRRFSHSVDRISLRLLVPPAR